MIKLTGLIKTFDLNPVLRGVDLHVREGEFVVLVGSNGAGKSTLLRIVATLMKPTAGEVAVGGWRLPQNAGKVRQHIGLVSHKPLLYDDLSAWENLSFFARLYGLDRRDERITRALKGVGLLARQADPVQTFSRGMYQRLAIARATLHEPDILLLDEPYTGLDQDASRILDGLLQQQKALGRTILMITHDFARGLSLCDRIVILHRGKIVDEVDQVALNAGSFLDRYATVTEAGVR